MPILIQVYFNSGLAYVLNPLTGEAHCVADAAVIGVPSESWGETPFAFYVPRDDSLAPEALIAWANERLGKTQRISGAIPLAELPRNAIGKILKRDLRALHGASVSA